MQLLCPVNSLRVKLRMTMNYKLEWRLYCLREVVICKKSCPSLFRLLSQNATDWVAYKQLEFISHSLEVRCPKSGCKHGQVWALFQAAHFSCILIWWKGQASALEPLIEAFISFADSTLNT